MDIGTKNMVIVNNDDQNIVIQELVHDNNELVRDSGSDCSLNSNENSLSDKNSIPNTRFASPVHSDSETGRTTVKAAPQTDRFPNNNLTIKETDENSKTIPDFQEECNRLKAEAQADKQTIVELRKIEKKYYELCNECQKSLDILPAKVSDIICQRDARCEEKLNDGNCHDNQSNNYQSHNDNDNGNNENDENEEDLQEGLLVWVTQLSKKQYTVEDDLEGILYSCYYTFVVEKTNELAQKLIELVQETHKDKSCSGEQLVFEDSNKSRYNVLKHFCECYESSKVIPEPEVKKIMSEYIENLNEYPLGLRGSLVFDAEHPHSAYVERALFAILEKKTETGVGSEWEKLSKNVWRIYPYPMPGITVWDVLPQV